MAKDVGDAIGAAIGHAAREVVDTVSANARKGSKKGQLPQLSGGKGMAAGAGLVALVPLAAKGAGMVVHSLRDGTRPLQAASDKVSDTVEGTLSKKVDEAGGASGLAKEAGKAILPFGGGKKSGGSGRGRRMPIQQAIDVALPIDEAYEQWTQYEEWPKFMHRLDRVSLEEGDDEEEGKTTISFKAKIWGISREFKAEIVDEQEGERIKWKVTEGVSHTGVVTFHELAPRLTRIDVDLEVTPGSMIEKMGRGMRHAKRAVRADLHRFKAHVEIEPEEDEDETGETEAQAGQDQQQEEQAQEKPSSRSSGSSRGRRAASSSSRSGSSRSGSGSSRSSGGSNGASASSGSSSRGRSRSSSANGSSSSRSGGSRSSSGGTRRRSSSRSS